MSRKRNAHKLIDQAAGQANALVEQAAVQATALVDQMAPHVEAARERVVTEYVPQARKASRRARKQVLEEYVPQARTAFEDAREAAGQALSTAATTAAAKSPLPSKPKKRRGRTVLKLAVLAGAGAAVGQWLRTRNVAPVSMYEAPSPTPSPVPPQAESPVPPGAVGEPNPAADELAQMEAETPPATDAPEDSLNTFFDEVLNETGKGSRRR